MKIFIVNGYMESGKGAFEEFVGKNLNGKVGVTSMVAYVKQIAEKLGWNGQKDEKSRKFLCDLKDLLDDWDDSPFATTCMMVEQMKNDDVKCCFIDSRTPSDIQRLKERLGAKTIFVRRGIKQNYTNHADNNVELYTYDIEIDNTGTLEELEQKAIEFINTELED